MELRRKDTSNEMHNASIPHYEVFNIIYHYTVYVSENKTISIRIFF